MDLHNDVPDPGPDPGPSAPTQPECVWQTLGFEPVLDASGLTGTIPDGVIAVSGKASNATFFDTIKGLPGPPTLIVAEGEQQTYFYRLAEAVAPVEASYLPEGLIILSAGARIALPADVKPTLQSIDGLPLLTAECSLVEPLPPAVMRSRLAGYSLLGRADEFERNAVEAVPLLGEVCCSGQATVFYAPPNAGKTLIGLKLLADAVQAKRLNPRNVYYINADDSSEGFATKMRLMDDLDVHTLAPGLAGFELGKLQNELRRMATDQTARGVLVIIDTLKKTIDILNKAQASEFADACRRFVMAGGTILAFAHTNKNASATGKLVYGGTADIVQDFDAAYIMTPIEGEGPDRIVKFEAIKRRGAGVEQTAYAYAADNGISYEERLASVRRVDPEFYEDFEFHETERADAELIEAVKAVIGSGIDKKMQLARAVARRMSVSERTALRVLETYTGTDPARHRWTYKVKERGAKIYEVLAADA